MLPMSAPVLLPQSGKALDIDAAVDALVLGKPNRLHRGAAVQGERAQGGAGGGQEPCRLLLRVEQRGGGGGGGAGGGGGGGGGGGKAGELRGPRPEEEGGGAPPRVGGRCALTH